jgi:cobalamin biosynthesis protein CbiG
LADLPPLGPGGLAVGFGCASYVEPRQAIDCLRAAFGEEGLPLAAVEQVGTIAKLASHPALIAVARAAAAQLSGYPPDLLDSVSVPTPSPYVKGQMGTHSVAEAAALLGAGAGARLIVPKRILEHAVTIAVAGRPDGDRPASA